MPEEILCPNCQTAIEEGAAFCGNCGFKLNQSVASKVDNGGGTTEPAAKLVSASGQGIPSYDRPHPHHKQHWAAMALVFGVLGLGGAILIPLLGIVFGLAALVLVTSSYRMTHGWLRSTGLALPCLSLALGLALWVRAYNDSQVVNANQTATSNGALTIQVNTPCYTLTFRSALNVNNNKDSCSMNAYNNTTLNNSTDVYKVLAGNTTTLNSANFANNSKRAILKDISTNLPGFNITNQASQVFAGSPAYYIQAYNPSANTAVIEETVLHDNSVGYSNFFVIVHAAHGQSVNLSALADSWQWND